MRIIRNIRAFRAQGNTVVTMGNFDGVHLGHQAIIRRVVDHARAFKCRSAVITFAPHTQSYLSVGRSCHVLSTPKEKAMLLKDMGVDLLIFLRFDSKLRSMDAEAFFKDLIFRSLKPKEVVFGHDHHFGFSRGGDENTLKKLCRDNNVHAYMYPAFKAKGQTISSTLLRELISLGKVEAATELMGHPYLVCGRVEKGNGVGRKLGFPTANLKVEDEKLLMPDGVYQGSAEYLGCEYPALFSLGTRPTFEGNTRLFEAYLDGFSGNLYGKTLCVNVKGFIRQQKRFKNRKELIKAIQTDLEHIN